MTQAMSARTTPDEACEALGIKKSQYYDRLKFIGIKANKDAEGTYLSAEQMKVMEELNEHIKETGKMEGFGGGGQLALSESSGLASALDIPVQPEIPGSEEDEDGLEQLIREAAELKVQQAAMPDLVRLHLANGMTEDDLPDDLKAKLQAVREAANPKQNAAAIAQQLLERHRQNLGKK
ncbi:MAG: hypothetical protein P2A85_29380 (plasmid) [Microcoleus anatoxicus]|uniref:hypothetical protein n=1 Tax=Microcoleus anatoxicus TaxID=2705319 RepID=UPI00366BE719